MDAPSLFTDPVTHSAPSYNIEPGPLADDYVPTPSWFAAAAIDHYFGDLGSGDVVLEPTAGAGHCLGQFRDDVFAYGIEIDPVLAQHARTITGREVYVGDVLTMPLPYTPTVVFGNIPYKLSFLDAFLDRFHRVLPEGGRIGFLVPAYFFQTSARVARDAQRWSIAVDIVPRDVFPGLHLPLAFARWTKETLRRLVGLAFHREVAEFRQFPEEFQTILTRAQRNVWTKTVLTALRRLGGRATVRQICAEVRGHRPTATQHWEAAVRKALQIDFTNLGHDDWAIPGYPAAA